MRTKVIGIIAALVTIIAAASASSACFLVAYQPKVPKTFR